MDEIYLRGDLTIPDRFSSISSMLARTRAGWRLAYVLCLVLLGLAGVCRATGAQGGARVAGLSPPALLAPEDGAVFSPIDALRGVLFSWSPIEGAVSYRLEWILVGTSTEMTVAGTTLFQSLQYSSGTRLDWRVTAVDASGTAGATSETRTVFIGGIATPTPAPQATPTPTASMLTPPTLLAPEDGAQFPAGEIQPGILLEWTAVTGASKYRINLTIGGVPQLPIETAEISYVFSLNIAGPTTIHWAVQALGPDGQVGSSSASRTIEILPSTESPTATPIPTLLEPPTLLSPADRAWIRSENLTAGVPFRWTEIEGAVGYVLQIWRGGAVELFTYSGQPSISVFLNVSEETDLLWSVATVNSAGVTGAYGPVRALRVRLAEPGDLDLTGTMNARDLYLFCSLWASSGESPLLLRADLDGDGVVDTSDLLQLMEILNPPVGQTAD